MLNFKNQAASLMLRPSHADSCAYYTYAFEKQFILLIRLVSFFVVVFFLLFLKRWSFSFHFHYHMTFMVDLSVCKHGDSVVYFGRLSALGFFSLYNIAQIEMCVCVM